MISFLAKIFIKDNHDTQAPAVRQAYGMLCGAVGIALNVLLFFGKAIAGILSGSIAITADAFNNLSDAGSSVITLVGFRLSGQKPDQEHPFGHGRMEYISGLLVSVAILIMGFELVKSSVGKILHPEPIETGPVIYGILLASILVKLYMCYYNRKIGILISSAAMKATAADSLNDMISTVLVLAAAVISQWTGALLDGWFGGFVGGFIFVGGIRAMKETVDPLLGQAPGRELVEQIRQIVVSYPDVYGFHDLIVHDYGPGRRMVSLHAEVPANGDLLAIHDEIDNIETELREKLHCSATIHMDPIVTDDAEVNGLRRTLEKLIGEVDDRLSIHDFRMVKGDTHTNLIFDVAVPYECGLKDVEVSNAVKEKIREHLGSRYFVVMQIDRVYC